MSPMPTNTCRYCREPIEWAITESRARMPLNIGPDPDGNVVVTGDVGGHTKRVRVLKKSEMGAPELGGHPGPRYMPHRATCPHYNKPKEKTA